MEEALHRRDRVGVQDFVLLEDYRNPKAFVENLRRRFKENLIYTYIGSVLVSVNPYQELPIYDDDVIKSYRNVNFYELPPHIFAITDEAYRMMRQENQDQCMLISGESGAGKTEASKKVLQYIATTSVHTKEVEKVKNRLLLSNPILEAFGNAKTNRNDNSSRFGKYMDVQFNFKGMPVGGHILNYLLEKSRVVHHAIGERNFHIFYQILCGNPSLKSVLHLNGSADQFYYLKQGHSIDVDSIDDAQNFKVIQQALNVCDFSLQEQQALFEVVASVLHLGNMVFVEDGDITKIRQPNEVQYVAELLGCPADKLMSSLHTKSIETKGERLSTPLTVDQSVYARDALAKGVYDRMFTWIVQKINSSLESKVMHRGNVIGLLDIYGFEIFESNKFEQFCINYCNEKLQQLFIELTLKSEQEEYLREGIEWEPVEYFNNKVICDLVEGKPLGIITVMDEECLRPGDVTDITLLSNMISVVGKHPHFVSHQTADAATRKTLSREDFRLKHYAGEVTYNINGFLDKNNDLLFRDLKEAMVQTTNLITSQCFPAEELLSKKRPDTAGTQFRASLAQLMDILMIKEPSYVRCIKPNDFKKSDLFDERIVSHQVQYLGLMENLRVRRAGFAYRRPYGIFLQRYKSLCPATWPKYHGSARDGVELLVKHLQYGPDEYKLGKSKLFIRQPQTLFRTEDSFQIRKQELATKIQARYKAFYLQKRFQIMKASSLTVQCQWRRYVAKQLLERRRNAAHAIRRFVNGYKHRMEPLCEENSMFIQFMKYNFLTELIKKLPKTVLDKSWPPAPPLLLNTSDMLHALCMKNMVLKYVKALPAARKVQLEQKVVAEGLFKNKKESYPFSVQDFFVDSRLAAHHEELKKNVFDVNIKVPEEKVLYSLPVTKYDRHGYKPRHRVMILTDKTIYVLNEKDFKIKDKLKFTQLKGMSLSALTDGFFLIDVDLESDNGSKGDVILQSEYAIEAVTKIVMATGMKDHVEIAQSGLTNHDMNSGKQGAIEFYRGETYGLKKSKSGHLLVTTPPIQ